MMDEKLSAEELRAVLDKLTRDFKANIAGANENAPTNFIRVGPIDLSTAKLETDPFPLNFPFRSVCVEDITDSSTYVYFKPYDQGSPHYKKLAQGDNIEIGLGVNRGYLHWPAQSGKTITLVLFVDAIFRSGKIISVNSGGVAINEGSAFSTSKVALTAATAGALLASNSSRKVATIQNTTGASMWLGTSSVSNTGANIGIELLNGASLQWRNTAALYGYSVGGGDVTVLEET